MMSPVDIPPDAMKHARIPLASSLAAMVRWAGRSGWDELAAQLRQHAMQLEQESLDPVLPARGPAGE
jgi:hypothetical protein